VLQTLHVSSTLRRGIPHTIPDAEILVALARLRDHLIIIFRHQNVCRSRNTETVQQ
jgi:hypothetical protein